MKKLIRSLLLNNLSERFYIRLAILYNNIKANSKERAFAKKIKTGIRVYHLPLVYISQPPRCGGTITRNLLDGHPALNVYPYELSWEKNGYHWESGLTATAKTFNQLKDKWISHAMNHGIDKQIPFEFSRRIQKELFLQQNPKSTRAVLDAYLSSFFNAWSNYNGIDEVKKYNVAFCPWVTVDSRWIDQFFSIYPDGFRVHLIRDPYAWWASEKSYTSRFNKKLTDYLIPHWVQSTREGIKMSQAYPGKYLLLSYETLVTDTKHTMKVICEVLNIPVHQNLFTPMLNGRPRLSNTSHGNKRVAIDASSLEKWKEVLNKNEIDAIRKNTATLFKSAFNACLNT